jgi:hypothetical protein
MLGAGDTIPCGECEAKLSGQFIEAPHLFRDLGAELFSLLALLRAR